MAELCQMCFVFVFRLCWTAPVPPAQMQFVQLLLDVVSHVGPDPLGILRKLANDPGSISSRWVLAACMQNCQQASLFHERQRVYLACLRWPLLYSLRPGRQEDAAEFLTALFGALPAVIKTVFDVGMCSQASAVGGKIHASFV